MYRLAIVEDEVDTRRRLISLIEKSGCPFTITGEYENGVDAYDGVTQDMPDLVITDIRVPYIDGIELARRLREEAPLVKVIILTGYSEYDYAKQAANLGVLGFINKPVTADVIRAALEKAAAVLDEEYLREASLSTLKDFYDSSLPVLRENDLFRLANMSGVPTAFETKLRHLGIRLDYRYFAMCVLDFDGSFADEHERFDLLFSTLRSLVGDGLRGLCEGEPFNRYDRLCVILRSDEPLPMAEVESRLERVLLQFERFSGRSVSAGISRAYENDRNFSAMLHEALHMLNYRSVMGGGKVFLYERQETGGQARSAVADGEVRELGYLLRCKSAGELHDAMERLWDKLPGEGQNNYYYLVTSVLNVFLRACDDPERIFRGYHGAERLYGTLLRCKSAEEAFRILDELAGEIRSINENMLVGAVEQNLQKVITYLDTHYTDSNLNFETLTSEVNFSASYISALLKKKMNTTFVKYLTGLRMEKARELLADPNLKIIDVAERLGYSDPYYFSHCFKKYAGCTPKEYRGHG